MMLLCRVLGIQGWLVGILLAMLMASNAHGLVALGGTPLTSAFNKLERTENERECQSKHCCEMRSTATDHWILSSSTWRKGDRYNASPRMITSLSALKPPKGDIKNFLSMTVESILVNDKKKNDNSQRLLVTTRSNDVR